MDKLLRKIIAILLVIILTSANLSILGMYGITYAQSDAKLAEQTAKTQNANVEFNAYFEGGSHQKIESMNSTSTKMFVTIKVKNAGYLKNGEINFNDANFKINGKIENDNIQSIDVESGKILLKQLNNGSDVTLEIPITFVNKDHVLLDHFKKETKTNFVGTYVDVNAKEIKVSKEIVNELSWNGEAEGIIKSELKKYVPYVLGDKYGIIIQAKINVSVKENKLPIKRTVLDVKVPEIDGVKPSKVNVIAVNTKASNGELNGVNFNSDNFTYNEETGIVNVTVENSQNEIVWLKNVEDEYLVTFIYEGQEIYNKANSNGINTNIKVDGNLEVYNNVETVLEKVTVNTEVVANEKLGTVSDFDIAVTNAISKGQIYANYYAKNKKEVDYSVRYIATVNNADITDKIEFNQGLDKFLTEKNEEALTTVSENNYAYNKKVIVDVNVFNKILGEDGIIEIFKQDKTKIAEINKDTKPVDGKYIIDISKENNNQLIITTSKPIVEGQLIIDIEKAIKTEIDYSKEQVKSFTKLSAELEGKASTSVVNANTQMLLAETKSVAELSISKKDLTTVVKNENVEIRATLNTNELTNALYKNPTLKIKLPSYISKIDIKHNLIMANGLKIKGEPQVVTENGSLVILITLEGIQEEYTINAEYKGTMIVLNANIEVKALTPTNTNKVTMEVTNANDVSINNKVNVETSLNFVAPVGVVAANSISNYANGQKDIMSITGEGTTGTLKTYSEKRIATITGTVINNYENSIGNVAILGRMPVKDNKNMNTNEALGSTFSTKLNSNIVLKGIDASKYTVYYSEKVDASADITNQANGWRTDATTETKSYLIVTNNYEMASGARIEFSYNVEIPANLTHNNDVYEMYQVYYNNNSSIGRMQEVTTSPRIGMTTGQGPELEASLTSTINTVREGQIIKMKATVRNTGDVTATNVKVNVPLPKYTSFVEILVGTGFDKTTNTTKVIDIGTLEPGKSKEISYYIKIDDSILDGLGDSEDKGPIIDNSVDGDISIDNNQEREIISRVTIIADDLSGEIYSNECKLNAKRGDISIEIVNQLNDVQLVSKGAKDQLIINLYNISQEENLENTVITINLPDGIIYKNARWMENWADNEKTDGIIYNETSNTLQINVGSLRTTKMVIIETEIGEFEGLKSFVANVKANGIEENYSNVVEVQSGKIEIQVSELTSTPKYIKEGEIVTYTLKLTNAGEVPISNIQVQDELPSALSFEKAIASYAGQEKLITTLQNNKVVVPIGQINAGNSATIKVMAKGKLLENKNDKEVQNKMSVVGSSIRTVETNVVKNIVEYSDEIHNQVEPDTPAITRYKITGTAWIDSNKNGKREENEEKLPNIPVLLLNKQDNSIVKDIDTNNDKKTTTDSSGKYEFTNLTQGEYIVIFVYDAARYDLTTYKEKDVAEDLNSDVININFTLDGTRRIVATTDAITISNQNARDIDMGVYSAEKFDLKLDKYISKITLTTPTIGTKTYTYNKSKLAKIEVLGQNLGKSNIVIEYKIVVTNEGAVAGYAKKLVDYLPKGVGFNTELNKDWYLSDNGNVYNASLANTIINPGESKEVTLIVTKKITEESLGTLNNNAEIYETYNEQGLKDIDSTVANKVQDEDDMSKADIVLGLVTGKIVTYTVITLAVIAILGFGIFEIKKRVLNKK